MSPQRRHELTDEQWDRLAPRLPSPRPRPGRPAHDHRTVLNGILWILGSGAPWRDLPERSGSWQSFSSRLRRWREAGICIWIWIWIWAQVLTALPADAAHDGSTGAAMTVWR